MNLIVREIKVILIKDGMSKGATVKVYEPVKSIDGSDVFCTVAVDGLLSSNKKIYGVDEQQAKALAGEFIASLLSDYIVQSEGGVLIDINKLIR